MAETDNIVLEHLRHIRGTVDVLRDDMREVKQRIGALETEVAQVNVRLAEVSNRIDAACEQGRAHRTAAEPRRSLIRPTPPTAPP